MTYNHRNRNYTLLEDEEVLQRFKHKLYRLNTSWNSLDHLKGDMTITKNLGMLFLAIYLILVGITSLIPMSGFGIVAPLCALVAGIFILIGR